MIAFWENKEFVIENYLTNKRTAVSPLIATLLQGLDNYMPKQHLLARIGQIPAVEEIVGDLTAQDVLAVKGSPLDIKERLIEKVWKWKQDARYFHYSTQHVVYESDMKVLRERLIRIANESSSPSPFKEYGSPFVKLLGSFDEHRGEFWDLLRARRTIRSFAPQRISLRHFSTLLLWTWGKSHLMVSPEIGPYILKTSPSGGARHPIEVYPVVLQVEGVQPGIYHYSVRRHALESLRTGNFQDAVVRLCGGQEWVRNAAVAFFMTAIVKRSMWKYEDSRTYRVLLLDAGHLGQTFYLVCTRLGLAPFVTIAAYDAEIERELGIDGVSEIVVYAAIAGVPSKSLDGDQKKSKTSLQRTEGKIVLKQKF